jgi:hypothetical protein
MIATPGAMPATPMVLFVLAPMIPVTNVPWPLASPGAIVGLTTLYGETHLTPARSGLVV